MRKISEVCSLYEGDKYQLVMGHDEYGEIKPRNLYRVGVITPVFEVEVFVLADSEDAAINQARCGFSLESYHMSENLAKYVHTHAELVPVMIQGWSARLFPE
jgi:hypothetical protein